MYPSIHLDVTSVTDLLRRWLSQHVAKEGLTWLDEKRKQIAGGVPERVFFTAFSPHSAGWTCSLDIFYEAMSLTAILDEFRVNSCS